MGGRRERISVVVSLLTMNLALVHVFPAFCPHVPVSPSLHKTPIHMPRDCALQEMGSQSRAVNTGTLLEISFSSLRMDSCLVPL